MRRLATLAPLALLAAGLPAAPPAVAADPHKVRVRLVSFATGLDSPVAMTMPRDGTGRLLVAEQDGRVRMVNRLGAVQAVPFLDITDRVGTGGERGLLGIAAHPAYARTGWLFVFYTDKQGDLRVSRFTAPPRGNLVNRNTELVILDIPHRDHSNHNGGQLQFGADNMLYVSTGDGGGGGDPAGNAQNLAVLLGKILRIDVARSSPTRRYAIPAGNPFVGRAGARPETWHFGLRNPWRFSFDPPDQRIWIGDVGQGAREEISVAARTQAGRNFGWDCREGTVDTTATYGGSYCSRGGFVGPFVEYAHTGTDRCAVIGGHVYRGSAYRSLLYAVYVYADFCSGEIWGAGRTTDGRWVVQLLGDHGGNLSSFGVDDRLELYATDLGGVVYKVQAVPA